MEKLTLRQLLEAVGGTLLGEFADLDATAADVCTDSRSITPGCLFIPLEGERFDGHSFINAALEAAKDAAFALGVSREIDPFMTLSFMSLPVIPTLRLTTRGVIDVDKQQYV